VAHDEVVDQAHDRGPVCPGHSAGDVSDDRVVDDVDGPGGGRDIDAHSSVVPDEVVHEPDSHLAEADTDGRGNAHTGRVVVGDVVTLDRDVRVPRSDSVGEPDGRPCTARDR